MRWVVLWCSNLVLLSFGATSGAAQEAAPARWFLTADLGAARIEGDNSLALGFGGASAGGRIVTSLWADLTRGAIGEDERYFWDTLSDGTRRCRDRTSGRFANSDECRREEARFGVMLDASYRFPARRLPRFVGLGYRFADSSTPYLTLGVALKGAGPIPAWFLRLVGGKDLIQADLAGSIPLPLGR